MAKYHELLTVASHPGGTLVVGGAHNGCLEGRAAIWVCEWDGKLSAARVRGRVALYGRFNTAKQHRWVQVAFAESPRGSFGGFTPVSVLGWSPCTLRAASVYFAAVNANPVDADSVLGLFPVYYHHPDNSLENMDLCYLGLALSCDGVHFGEMEKLVDLGCGLFNRVVDYPVDGFGGSGDDVFFYVHRDMPTEDHVRAFGDHGSATLAPRLVRHAIPRAKLAAWTDRARAALP